MIYTAQLFIGGEYLIDLFEIDIKESEMGEIADAVFCEMRFNGTNFIL